MHRNQDINQHVKADVVITTPKDCSRRSSDNSRKSNLLKGTFGSGVIETGMTRSKVRPKPDKSLWGQVCDWNSL